MIAAIRLTNALSFCSLFLLTVSTNLSFGAEDAVSIYRVSPWTDGAIILSTSLGSVIPAVNQDHLIHPHCPCDVGGVNALDRHVIGNESHTAELISDATLGLALAAPPLLDAYALGWSRQLAEDLTIYAEVLSVSGAFVTLAKFTVQRPIPRVYAGQAAASDPENYGSFYSGHVNLTFAALTATAVTTNLRYHWGAWPWVIAGSVGLSVAEERVLAGRHFYTDVAMATLAGTLFGVSIPLLHKFDSSEQALSISHKDSGMELSWSRYF